MTAPNITRVEAQQRAALLRIGTYHVVLDLRDDEVCRSRVRVDLTCTEPGASSWVDVTADRLVSASLDGRPVDVAAYTGTRLPLPALTGGSVLEVVSEHRWSDSGEGLTRVTDPADGAVYVTSQCAPMSANRIHACFDQPDLKAAWELTVTAPDGWSVLANGRADGEPVPADGGGLTWRLTTTERMASYLLAVCAGPWHTVTGQHDGIDLSVSCRTSLSEHLEADDVLTITRAAFDHYHRLFGVRYPFTGGYDQVFVPEFNWGAMENPGCVTFNERYLFRSRQPRGAYQRRAEVIAHEMAHMWFGDLVTMRWWDDTWLNESFATYMASMTLVEATQYETEWTWYALQTKARAAMQDQLPSTHPIADEVADVHDAAVNFDGITYDKGASVLKQLVAWVGREEFFTGLRSYFDAHAFGSATLADLLVALERASGRELATWSRLWLQTSGPNTLTPVVEGETVLVRQDGQPLRPHRVRVAAYTLDDGALVLAGSAELDVIEATTVVPGLAPTDLLVVNDADLTYAKLRFDPRSLATLTAHLSQVPEQLTRAVCWTGLWDLVRDAELPARAWLAVLHEHLPTETDPALLAWLLNRATESLDYVADNHRPAAASRLASWAWAHAAQAAPGSDRQLLFVRAWIAATDDTATDDSATDDTDEDTATLAGLLDGSRAPVGLSVDTDLRWQVLQRLTTLGAAGENEIAAELERDPTYAGQRAAALARASRPEAAAKQAAWEAVVLDRVSKTLQESAMQGFHRTSQGALLTPFATLYLEQVARLWQERSTEKAMLAAEMLYPATQVDPTTLTAVDAWLAKPGRPAALVRLVAEGRSQAGRLAAARAADARAGDTPTVRTAAVVSAPPRGEEPRP